MNEMIAHRIVTIGLLSLTLLACTNSNSYYQADKAHHTAVGFINSDPSLVPKNWLDVLHWRLTESPAKSDQPISIPRVEVNLEKLRQPTAPQATWIGHSTMLVQSDGLTFLTDPIFSERASPLSFVGPKRHQPPALSVEQLPLLMWCLFRTVITIIWTKLVLKHWRNNLRVHRCFWCL